MRCNNCYTTVLAVVVALCVAVTVVDAAPGVCGALPVTMFNSGDKLTIEGIAIFSPSFLTTCRPIGTLACSDSYNLAIFKKSTATSVGTCYKSFTSPATNSSFPFENGCSYNLTGALLNVTCNANVTGLSITSNDGAVFQAQSACVCPGVPLCVPSAICPPGTTSSAPARLLAMGGFGSAMVATMVISAIMALLSSV